MHRWYGRIHAALPLFLTVPHSGERLPDEADWLLRVAPAVLLTDVDRFVDQLYLPAVENLPLPLLKAETHRYAADLNRYPDDVDPASVIGSANARGSFPWGFHWSETTQKHRLMAQPIADALHRRIIEKYHDPFHSEIEAKARELNSLFPKRDLLHLDCHSMPSQGTSGHADSGQRRPGVVISDFGGKSSGAGFKDSVIDAFRGQGFEVSYNWPYKGGRITQRYGRPHEGHHTIQIELNRALYMDEKTFERLPGFDSIAKRLEGALASLIQSQV